MQNGGNSWHPRRSGSGRSPCCCGLALPRTIQMKGSDDCEPLSILSVGRDEAVRVPNRPGASFATSDSGLMASAPRPPRPSTLKMARGSRVNSTCTEDRRTPAVLTARSRRSTFGAATRISLFACAHFIDLSESCVPALHPSRAQPLATTSQVEISDRSIVTCGTRNRTT
jgi:hypothetical protein